MHPLCLNEAFGPESFLQFPQHSSIWTDDLNVALAVALGVSGREELKLDAAIRKGCRLEAAALACSTPEEAVGRLPLSAG
jgi:hypothetical protein